MTTPQDPNGYEQQHNERRRTTMSKTSKTIRSAVSDGYVTTTEPHDEGRHVYVVLGHPVHGLGRMALTPDEARAFAGHLSLVADEIDGTTTKAPTAPPLPPFHLGDSGGSVVGSGLQDSVTGEHATALRSSEVKL
jgi:hypothetical protein